MGRPILKVAIFPGTFDPLTLGHLDIIDRGRKLFDKLIVAVGINPEKDELFSVQERLALIRTLTKKFSNVSVEAYEGLTVNLVQKAARAAAILAVCATSPISIMSFASR